MLFVKKNIWTMFAVILAVTVMMMGNAYAQQGDIMDLALTKTVNVFKRVKAIVFVLGGFGLVAVAFLAIFGKVQWKWFAGLAVGLAVVAAAGAIIQYSTGNTQETGRLEDTFSNVQGM